MTRQPPTWIDSVLQTGVPAYPAYDVPISDWHPAVFESAFIALHPFSRAQTPVSWGEVAAAIGLSVGRLNRALLTWSGALRTEFADSDAAARLRGFCELSGLDAPLDGSLPLIWTPLVVAFFRAVGADQLWVRDEFGEALSPCAALAEPLDRSLGRSHRRGAIFSAVPGVLASVDWDSFFTLFFAPQSQLATLSQAVEGFVCAADTRHYWNATPEADLAPTAG